MAHLNSPSKIVSLLQTLKKKKDEMKKIMILLVMVVVVEEEEVVVVRKFNVMEEHVFGFLG